MDPKLEDLIARVMQLPPESRRYLAQLLAESTGFYEVRDSGEPVAGSSIPKGLLPQELTGMTSVTVVLPDELVNQAQAAGLLAGKPLEELIRRALKEQGINKPSSGSAPRQRRRLIRQSGHLIVEALAGEQPVTDTEIRGLLNKMEW
jgi:hypothetical protein